MKVLLIYVPSRLQSVNIPYGLLYIASSIFEEGHEAKIIDLSLDEISNQDLISRIREYGPDLIGFSAITSGYKNLKELTKKIKADFPATPLIAGGVIASISQLVLAKTCIDIVVLKEGEIVIKHILRAMAAELPIANVKGIAYKTEGGYKENPPEAQISNMDNLPLLYFKLIDLERYLTPVADYMDSNDWSGVLEDKDIEKIKASSKYVVPIFSSRGCTNSCSFCYRHLRGIRQFSPAYMINQIKYFKSEYGVNFFQFIDELTNVTGRWCHEFCDLLQAEKLNITYVINGARVDNIDEDLLKHFKQTGCIKIGFGYESGSQRILDHIGKGVSRKKNCEVASLMKKVGLYDNANIMIGFPPECPQTIRETIDFLKTLDSAAPSINFVLPFPRTADWNYCREKGLIKEEEDFILGYDEACKFKINLTGYPDRVVAKWHTDILDALRLEKRWKDKKYIEYWILSVYFNTRFILKPFKPFLNRLYERYFQTKKAG